MTKEELLSKFTPGTANGIAQVLEKYSHEGESVLPLSEVQWLAGRNVGKKAIAKLTALGLVSDNNPSKNSEGPAKRKEIEKRLSEITAEKENLRNEASRLKKKLKKIPKEYATGPVSILSRHRKILVAMLCGNNTSVGEISKALGVAPAQISKLRYEGEAMLHSRYQDASD